MSTFQPGEIVDITIKGARIYRGIDGEPRALQIEIPQDDGSPYYTEVPHEWDAVTVERVAPAEWPPRPGDLWRDRDGDLWLTRPADANGIFLVASNRDKVAPFGSRRHVHLLRDHGPLTLVHREDGQDGQDGKTPTAGAEVPGRPGRVFGDCGHPVWRAAWDSGERTCQPCGDFFAAEMSGGRSDG